MYNGYTNYETWSVSLWIDNEQGSQEYWQEVTVLCMEENETEPKYKGGLSDALVALAVCLESEIKDNAPEVDGMYGDLLTSALDTVDWRDIAETMIETAKENAEYAAS